jgi:hypothetical protein
VSKNTGITATFDGTHNALDFIRSALKNGFWLPDWVTNDVYNQMAIVYCKDFEFSTLSELSLRLRGGNFFDSYIQWNEDLIQNFFFF